VSFSSSVSSLEGIVSVLLYLKFSLVIKVLNSALFDRYSKSKTLLLTLCTFSAK
jgi:hypothetical protein